MRKCSDRAVCVFVCVYIILINERCSQNTRVVIHRNMTINTMLLCLMHLYAQTFDMSVSSALCRREEGMQNAFLIIFCPYNVQVFVFMNLVNRVDDLVFRSSPVQTCTRMLLYWRTDKVETSLWSQMDETFEMKIQSPKENN